MPEAVRRATTDRVSPPEASSAAAAGRILRPDVWANRNGGAGTSSQAERAGRDAEAAKPTVLVVDDDSAIVRMLRLVLRGEGFDVLTASNGEEALDAVASCHPSVIVLDLAMPVMDGRTFFRELRERGDDTPVIILSAYGAQRAQRELSAEAGLDKPVEPDRLVAEVQRLLQTA